MHLVEKFNAVIYYSEEDAEVLGKRKVTLQDCDSYKEAVDSLERYISEMDYELDDYCDYFRFEKAVIEKKFVREWDY